MQKWDGSCETRKQNHILGGIMKIFLHLENGMVFEGQSFGEVKETIGEVVFHTGMTGYEELLSDPSYHGQMVVLTQPLVGNYGITLEDLQSDGPKLKALIVREAIKEPSGFRCEIPLPDFLSHHRVPGMESVDTRALTRVLREHGTMKGLLSERRQTATEIRKKLQSFDHVKPALAVTTKERYTLGSGRHHLAVMDFGIKRGILEEIVKRDWTVTVFPADTKAEVILSEHPDKVLLSNGPGDPESYQEILREVKKLMGKVPLLGICLGHQLLALALGGKTEKLLYGHRGANHPVQDLETGKVFITSQNHGYVVTVLPEGVSITHRSLQDGTVEGICEEKLQVRSVQFHPEASPGPSDAGVIFDKMLEMEKEK